MIEPEDLWWHVNFAQPSYLSMSNMPMSHFSELQSLQSFSPEMAKANVIPYTYSDLSHAPLYTNSDYNDSGGQVYNSRSIESVETDEVATPAEEISERVPTDPALMNVGGASRLTVDGVEVNPADPLQTRDILNPETSEEALPGFTDAAADIPVEAGEALQVAESVGVDVLGPASLVAMIGQAGAQALTSFMTSQMTNQAYTNFNNAMSYGHGIGFQSIANQNLQNSITDTQNFSSALTLAGQMFGPVGSYMSAALFGGNNSNFYSAPVSNYTVETPGGQFVNAQNNSVINSDSYDDTTN